MNKQTLIDKVKTEYKGWAYCDDVKHSLYLTKDGRKCIIGLCIPDGHEGQNHPGTVDTLLEKYPDLWQHMPSKNVYKLISLQEIHDFHFCEELALEDQKRVLIEFIERIFE